MIKIVLILLISISHTYEARIKTKSKSIVGTTVEAKDQFEAEFKIKRRYPDSTILNMKMKK